MCASWINCRLYKDSSSAYDGQSYTIFHELVDFCLIDEVARNQCALLIPSSLKLPEL
jgi:hypothetical protein